VSAASPAASLADFGLGGKAAPKRQGDLGKRITLAAAAAASPPLPARTTTEPPPRAEEIVVYWERLRRGRPRPSLDELDRGLVATAWPDSLIVLFEQDPAAMPRVARLGAADGAIEYTPMVTDWILTRARHTAAGSERREEIRDFPLGTERPRYRLFLLPLDTAASGGGVLCHLCRAF